MRRSFDGHHSGDHQRETAIAREHQPTINDQHEVQVSSVRVWVDCGDASRRKSLESVNVIGCTIMLCTLSHGVPSLNVRVLRSGRPRVTCAIDCCSTDMQALVWGERSMVLQLWNVCITCELSCFRSHLLVPTISGFEVRRDRCVWLSPRKQWWWWWSSPCEGGDNPSSR